MKAASAEHVLPMFCACRFQGNSMNNLLSYCGLVDARTSASDKDIPVSEFLIFLPFSWQKSKSRKYFVSVV